jgi:hypothetical protein
MAGSDLVSIRCDRRKGKNKGKRKKKKRRSKQAKEDCHLLEIWPSGEAEK